ncbi:MAG TPA: D-aminoacylase [Deltaproteobacteria bacterium]|nr:D-aminoacylase [Deltaproteobacteria bacterium]HCP46553.1 D-aminoacylase [Deltaproteobacteria bacterium]
MSFDRILVGGMLLDGTGAEGRLADIGVRDQAVAAIEPPGTLAGTDAAAAAETHDISGLVVCPTFIDTHTHSDLEVFNDPALPMKAHQGIGIDVLGQDGISVAPFPADRRPLMERVIAGLDGVREHWDWESVSEYLACLEKVDKGIHLAYLVPHGNLRLEQMGMEDRPPTTHELEAMTAGLDRDLQAGGVGLSTGLIYPPCCYSDTDELIALGQVLARHDRPLVVHMRSESDALQDGVNEMLDVGRKSGCRIHISHLKIAGKANWPLVDWLLGCFDQAEREGIILTADQYPYTAGSTMMGAILPPWAHAGGFSETVARLGKPDERARIRDWILRDAPHDWDNFWSWGGPSAIVVADIPSGNRPEALGCTIAELAESVNVDPLDYALDLLQEEHMGVAMVAFSQSEDVVAALMAHPRVNGCTDGLLLGRPHPRAYGSFPRILGRFVRDRKICSLPEAIRKLTSQAADALTLKGRGRVAVGSPADLVVFDAAQVEDLATYREPRQYPVGIPHVLIGGEFLVRDDRLCPSRRGRVLRG